MSDFWTQNVFQWTDPQCTNLLPTTLHFSTEKREYWMCTGELELGSMLRCVLAAGSIGQGKGRIEAGHRGGLWGGLRDYPFIQIKSDPGTAESSENLWN